MGRLIDAEHLKEKYCELCSALFACEGDEHCFFLEQLQKEPTAYDVEKVKYQLRCKTFSSGISAVINFDDVMKIIEKGGVE